MNKEFCDIYLIILNKYKRFSHRKIVNLIYFIKNSTVHAFRALCPTIGDMEVVLKNVGTGKITIWEVLK